MSAKRRTPLRQDSSAPSFGGPWTAEKLDLIREYLTRYMLIFKNSPKASYYQTVYVDAFAGAGRRAHAETDASLVRLLDTDPDGQELLRGSARVALEIDPPFDRYLFIEKNPDFVAELEQLKDEFPERSAAIDIRCDDANRTLQQWCASSDWRRQRAVVFLDPFGTETSWPTVEALAGTQGVDLWYLFPALDRLLPRLSLPEERNAACVSRILGTEEWLERFYRRQRRPDLFNRDGEVWERHAGPEEIKAFIVERLASVFKKVAPRPRELVNSKNVTLFLLCFAASNPRGADIAVRIANHLLTRLAPSRSPGGRPTSSRRAPGRRP